MSINISTTLDILRLDKEKLKQLLGPYKPGSQKIDSTAEKLIAQFHYGGDGKLAIGLFPSKKKNQAIGKEYILDFDSAKKYGVVFQGNDKRKLEPLDISKLNIFLGDQEISEGDFEALKKQIDKKGPIYFIPKMVPGNHVTYDMATETTTEGELEVFGSANPSPPKDCY